jgi:hypothetical protein
MFLLECPSCGQRELRSTRSLSSFANTANGIELAMSCSRCGTSVHTLTGARAGSVSHRAATPVAAPAPAPAGAAA